ncbi:MAG: hypothetical protein HYT76_09150 [Deltaproteobacteria bacterium]|nr:hypothetical protein [Deltaproteobacteria bacterium]
MIIKKIKLVLITLAIALTTGCAASMDLWEKGLSSKAPSTEEAVFDFDPATAESGDTGDAATSDSVSATTSSPSASPTTEGGGTATGGSTTTTQTTNQASKIILRGQLTPP